MIELHNAKRKLVLAFCCISFCILLVYDYSSVKEYEVRVLADVKYLVDNPKCRIVNLEAFNPDAKKFYYHVNYFSCRDQDLLTYISKENGSDFLQIDEGVLNKYPKVTCCYANVTRVVKPNNPDNNIHISSCQPFNKSVEVANEVVSVKCINSKKKQVYENVHAVYVIKESVRKKMESSENSSRVLSVLLVGIDSISRLNLIRSLPKTYKYLESTRWISLKGYNKMDDNTFPNLMAILTGYNQSDAYRLCDPKKVGKLDNCPMLWYDYRNLGYVTAYAEDESKIATFNYKKKGFTVPPTDYYFRPYMIAAEKQKLVYKGGMTYCTGPESSGERILNLAKNFGISFEGYPKFGLFWMNTFSHNDLNQPSGMDEKVKEFLKDLHDSGVLDSTMVIFFSDHGMRFGKIRETRTGWLEERLPFIYFSLPTWFKLSHPKAVERLKINSNRLTNPYDVFMTLQDVLVMSGLNYTVKASRACPKCRSLFKLVEFERSCEDAGIEYHWCTCSAYSEVQLDKKISNKLGNFLVQKVNSLVQNSTSHFKCANYKLNKVIGISLSEKFEYKNESYVLIGIETKPKAVFESTLKVLGLLEQGKYSISTSVSRLDSYDKHSRCVADAELKKYCYCR